MMQAELDAVVTSGAHRAKQPTYALFDERVPPAPSRDHDDMLLDLVLRYFTTRGPATAHDFAWWSGRTVADARRAIDAAGGALERVEVDGRPHWLAIEVPTPRRSARSAHLLPNYDEYFIAYKDRSAIARRLGSLDTVTGANALLPHVAFLDGQLVGSWKRVEDREGVIVELNLQARLSRAERRRLDLEAARFGRFLGQPVRVRNARR